MVRREKKNNFFCPRSMLLNKEHSFLRVLFSRKSSLPKSSKGLLHTNQPKFEYSIIIPFLPASSLGCLWMFMIYLNCTSHSRVPDSYRTSVIPDQQHIFTFQETHNSLWTLVFLSKACHFPLKGHLTIFRYTRLSHHLFHHWHITSIETKVSSLHVGLH